jgi:hypothetical protein
MQPRHKNILRAITGSLRRVLAGAADEGGTWQRGDLDRELERIGFAPDGTVTPLDALPNATRAEQRAYIVANTRFNGLPQAERVSVRTEMVEQAAYTWMNRLLALRAMEARGLIDETLRHNPDYDGLSEALYVLRQTDPARCAGPDGGWWAVLEDACTQQAAALPGLFRLDDPVAALRPSVAALRQAVALIGGAPSGFTLEDADAAFADPDAIGWAYQFYQEQAKAEVYASLGQGQKAATRAQIAAATQLFTEPYMVKWLLQNSLGRSYHEASPDSALPATWEYYIRGQGSEVMGDGAAVRSHTLDRLTLLDPCCGSGHFLREAFDMFVAMYREQQPDLPAAEVADRIFSRHLFGIDIDPRAAQLAVLTLYLRAWELVKQHAPRRIGQAVRYEPQRITIATTPSGLHSGLLTRHLQRHPGDRVMRPLLEGVFAALEQADILGSLLRPAEHLDEAINKLRQPHTFEMDFDADDAALRRTITDLARHDPDQLKRTLLERIAASFQAEASESSDVAAVLFGREAAQGVRLLQLLDRRYAVVATNPPYMGSKNMNAPLKSYVSRHYPAGKRDLYAAFILRCLELCQHGGRMAMITQQSWMFLSSFTELRAGAAEQEGTAKKPNKPNSAAFRGLLRETTIEGLAHLGPNAFEEVSGEVVQSTMFTLQATPPHAEHRITALRLVGLKSAGEKARILREATATTRVAALTGHSP